MQTQFLWFCFLYVNGQSNPSNSASWTPILLTVASFELPLAVWFPHPMTGPESANAPRREQQLERKDSLQCISPLTSWPFESWQLWLLSDALRLLYILFYSASQFFCTRLFWYKLLLHSQKWKPSSRYFSPARNVPGGIFSYLMEMSFCWL